MRNCTVNGAGCIVCPEIPEVPAQPGFYDVSALVGWNGGANSQLALGGDLLLRFTMGFATSVVCGIRHERDDPTNPYRIANGFLFVAAAGSVGLFSVIEHGREKTSRTLREEGDVFELRRVGDRVSYYRNDELVYTAEDETPGTVIATGCLYASGDAIGYGEGGGDVDYGTPQEGDSPLEWSGFSGGPMSITGFSFILPSGATDMIAEMTVASGTAMVGLKRGAPATFEDVDYFVSPDAYTNVPGDVSGYWTGIVVGVPGAYSGASVSISWSGP
jgi:hypothetical protein